ncbi:MAG: BON domain-containing protein [Bryobacterales bacterium]|nr:BON domain-containing protein [Bryobacterales bacterium]
MTRKVNGIVRKAVLGAALLALPIATFAETKSVAQEQAEQQTALVKKVRHELVMLPFLSVFDNLAFRVEDNGVVTLTGQTIRPTIKSQAGNVVKQLEGVHQVVNNIEVLPLSRFDDDIRIAVARAVYGYPALQRYGLGAQPPIRIIVKNGDVSLEGVVANSMDKNLAFQRANGVSGVFQVKNNLQVEKAL